MPSARPKAPARLVGKPFTIEHFEAWTKRLVLKDGRRFVLEPWQRAFVEDVFAGFQECWLIVPEGNGKSTLVAVVILYCCEFAADASIPVAASARDQAEIIFAQATGFVRRSPSLKQRFQCKPGLREIVFGDDGSKAKIFASDAGTADGIIPWPIEVLDELHRHKSLDLYHTWAGKLDKEGSQLIVISTAGTPGGEFEAVRESIRQTALESSRDGCFGRYVGANSVLHEYAVPENGDVEDLELVSSANPSSRITVETLEAKRSRPSFNLTHWRRLTCNVPTRDGSAAITEREWYDAATAEVAPDDADWWVGLDVGWRWDTTAFVPLWWRDSEFRLLGAATILTPPTDHSSLPVGDLKRAMLDLTARLRVSTVVMDMNRAEDIGQWLSDELGLVVVDRAQSSKPQGEDYERFMSALRQGWLLHSADEGLRRHALNAVSRLLPDGGAKFDRPERSRTGRQDSRVIDALIAAAMVHSVRSAPATATGGWTAV